MLGCAIIVIGWAYAQSVGSHIRVDVIYTRLSNRKKALIDTVFTGLFFFPVFSYFTFEAFSTMWRTLTSGKFISLGYGGAPPFPFFHSFIITFGLFLFTIQFGAKFIRDVYMLTKGQSL
jgi:TRAP-type mannitol/chloroaromatic compound transport system permease small subunit